jgi:mannose-6-phosphate isomerase-like protein (cupin superfamily)
VKVGSQARMIPISQPDIPVDDDDFREKRKFRKNRQQRREFPAIKPAGLVGRRVVHPFGDCEIGMRIGPIAKQNASCNGVGICVMDVRASDHTLRRNTGRIPFQRRSCLETLLVERWDHLTSSAWIARITPMATVDQKAVEKDWTARGFSCDLWIDAPGRVWRNFIHETDELVMLVEGEEEFEMNGQIHRLEIGQELLIPAGTYHTARNVGRGTSKWLYGYKGR